MFNSVHHIHYVVSSRDDMVEYIRANFGMEPEDLHTIDDRGMKDALYRVGETLIEITEPLDPRFRHRQALGRARPGRLSRSLRCRQHSSRLHPTWPPRATPCAATVASLRAPAVTPPPT